MEKKTERAMAEEVTRGVAGVVFEVGSIAGPVVAHVVTGCCRGGRQRRCRAHGMRWALSTGQTFSKLF